MAGRRAFTLMEILMAVALAAAMAGFAAMGIGLFSEGALKSRQPDRVFLSALREAQAAAVRGGKKVELSFDKSGFFLLRWESGEEIARFWLSKEFEDAAKAEKSPQSAVPDVSFLARAPEVVGSETIEFPGEPLRCVRVSPDGVCSPVSAYFSYPNEKPLAIKIDPMSAAQADF